ncbi:hypothetical protein HON52_01650 [Candidatus Uhrbacteria bacterium]|nr:hypothetical protein [Candidatus Uhrbacteria bacterium]
MWEPVVEAGRDLARHGLCQGVRARYFNQETGEYEEVDVLRITDATKMPVHSSDDYEEAVYVFIRRDDGEELHVQASLICKKGKDGEEPKPEYIFTPRASV